MSMDRLISESKTKIGILGGTFDPIHNGHLLLGQCAVDQLDLDFVLFVPSGQPPHKLNQPQQAGVDQRLDMVRLAIKDRQRFILSDADCQHQSPSYTVHLLKKIQEQYPSAELYFIMGADSLFQIEQWYHYRSIFSLCQLVVAKRNAQSDDILRKEIIRLERDYQAKIVELVFPGSDISSSYIRSHYAKPAYLQDMIPEAVYRYIGRQGLYHIHKQPTGFSYSDILSVVQDSLSKKRMMHVMGVVYTAAALANRHAADREMSMIAAVLHDFAKEYSAKQLLGLAEQYKLPIRPIEEQHPYLLHGAVAAAVSQEQFGIVNEDILNAMRYHTTGRPKMSLIEKIIFLADYIEPLRMHMKEPERIRQTAMEDLDMAVYLVTEETLSYLRDNGRPIDEMTVLTNEYYRKETGND